MSITLTIDENSITVPDGGSVLDAINASATYISQLCKDPDMKAIGACRTCLVQIDGIRGFPASCSTPAAEGMIVQTDSDDARRIRAGVIELTMAMLPATSENPPFVKGGRGDFGQLTTAADHHNIQSGRWETRPREATDESSTVFNIAMESCILCGRCAEACQDGHQFIGAIDFLGAGRSSRIGTFMDKPLSESICTTCGQCLSVCPTGAIHLKEKSPQMVDTPLPEGEGPGVREVSTTCPYCGVGCGIKVQVGDGDQIVEVLDDPENLSSVGMLCVKGRFGTSFVHHPDRLTTPLIKENGEFRPASWDEALDLIAEQIGRAHV
jgi:predicted molibdopterin-dependent oxidoreductase YjgC